MILGLVLVEVVSGRFSPYFLPFPRVFLSSTSSLSLIARSLVWRECNDDAEGGGDDCSIDPCCCLEVASRTIEATPGLSTASTLQLNSVVEWILSVETRVRQVFQPCSDVSRATTHLSDPPVNKARGNSQGRKG